MSQTQTLNTYRASFIFDTRSYEEPVDTLTEKVKSVIQGMGGEVSEVKELGQKDFVRVTNRKFPQGLFVQFVFNGPTESSVTLQEKFRLDRTVYRILVESV